MHPQRHSSNVINPQSPQLKLICLFFSPFCFGHISPLNYNKRRESKGGKMRRQWCGGRRIKRGLGSVITTTNGSSRGSWPSTCPPPGSPLLPSAGLPSSYNDYFLSSPLSSDVGCLLRPLHSKKAFPTILCKKVLESSRSSSSWVNHGGGGGCGSHSHHPRLAPAPVHLKPPPSGFLNLLSQASLPLIPSLHGYLLSTCEVPPTLDTTNTAMNTPPTFQILLSTSKPCKWHFSYLQAKKAHC